MPPGSPFTVHKSPMSGQMLGVSPACQSYIQIGKGLLGDQNNTHKCHAKDTSRPQAPQEHVHRNHPREAVSEGEAQH